MENFKLIFIAQYEADINHHACQLARIRIVHIQDIGILNGCSDNGMHHLSLLGTSGILCDIT